MTQTLLAGKNQFFDANGDPLVGGKLYTWNPGPGITTPKATYFDAAGAVPHANPIVLDGRGEAEIFWSGGYNVKLESATGALIYVVESINTEISASDLRTDLANISDAAKGPSMVGFGILSYPASTVGGGIFTTVFGDGVTDKSADLVAANALGYPIRIKGVAVVNSPTTITVPILDAMSRMFSDTSQITVNNGLPVRPEWWGSAAGNIMRAVNALPSAGGTVQLENKVYPPSYSTITPAKVAGGTAAAGVDYLAKTGIKLLGRKLPNYKAPVSSIIAGMEGGTIIQGPFYFQAPNFEIDNIGIDSGPDVVAALYGGTAQDGLVGVQSNQVTPFYVGGLRVGRVMGLCKDINSTFHACLFEALADGTIQEATGAQAFHGVVIKSKNIQADLLRGIGNSGEGVLCKSDNYAPLGVVKINQVEASSISAGVETGHGFICDAVTASASSVQVGIVRVLRKANGCTVRSNGANLMTDVQIGELTTEGCFIGTLLTGDIRRVSIDSAVVNNATYGAQVETNVTSPTVSIGTLKVTNAQYGVYLGGKLSLANLEADTLSGAAINYYDVGARIILGTFRLNAVTGGIWNQQPALAGTWVNEGTAGNPTFNANQLSGRVCLSGWIKGGGAAALTTITTPTRPLTNRVWKAPGRNGATEVTVTIRLDATSGALTCPDYATASSYISLDGVEWDAPY